MKDLSLALLALHGVFLFATAVGFAVPLAIAGSEKRAERAEERKRSPSSPLDYLGPLLDLWLLLEDAIPVFWLFGLLRDAPYDVRAAREKWREEPSIRLFFWISVALLAALPLHFLG